MPIFLPRKTVKQVADRVGDDQRSEPPRPNAGFVGARQVWCCPASEINFLLSSGFSSTEIDDFTQHVATSTVCVSGNVSVSDLFGDGVIQLTPCQNPLRSFCGSLQDHVSVPCNVCEEKKGQVFSILRLLSH